jgi:hypothetical protein
VDCTAASLVTLLIALSLLIIPMVFYVLFNRHVIFLKFMRPCDCIGDQSLGRSLDGFPESHAV